MKTAYTDYPFLSLGDEAYKLAPVREIKILSYDGNKYVKIIVEGIEEEIKSGYIYTNAERYEYATKMKFPRTHIGMYID